MKSRKKALKATWRNDDHSSSSKEEFQKEEKANLCLVALDNKVNDGDSISKFLFKELYDAFNNLLYDFKKLSHKSKKLKKENQSLNKDKAKVEEDMKKL